MKTYQKVSCQPFAILFALKKNVLFLSAKKIPNYHFQPTTANSPLHSPCDQFEPIGELGTSGELK